MQYGQRKLQRSITEMRRSRIGRARVSRGAGRRMRGTMTSGADMLQVWDGGRRLAIGVKGESGTGRGQPSRPAAEACDEALLVGIRARRQLDESVGTGEGRE